MRIPDTDRIFAVRSEADFEESALGLFRFQASACGPYRDYLRLAGVDPASVDRVADIPFLPIELFKTHRVYSARREPEKVFTSSSTTGTTPSRHYVADLSLYERAFTAAFRRFYGSPEDTAIFALLPGYLEREGSSLIYMADRLIGLGRAAHGWQPYGGFYLDDLPRLLRDMEACPGPKILLGVSYALWDMAERFPVALRDTVVMETGGMKGQREELPREAFHRLLCDAFGVQAIHSEYGMAELMSQAYSRGGGLFETPPWMRVVIRDLHDPFLRLASGQTGGVNIIDLANLWSCSFIQTRDLGVVYPSGAFRVLGRIDGSEIRGCNLLVQ